jgi:hypothetical protein
MSMGAVTPLRHRMIERHERAETLCGHAEGPHSQLQAVCRVSQSLSGHSDDRGHWGGRSDQPRPT